MYQDSKRTCTAIVLLIKPFVWWRSRCRRRRRLLTLPTVGSSSALSWSCFSVDPYKLNYSVMLVNSQLVCLPSSGILKPIMLI